MARSPAAGRRWSGAVLTGGQSTRMARDKALVEVDGVPMAVRVAAALGAGGASPVVCVGGDLPGLTTLGLRAEPDPRQGDGPLAGVVSALELLASGSDGVVVAACDLPWLDAATVAALVAQAIDEPDADVACAFTDRPEPLCAAWRPAALQPLRAAYDSGERAVRRAWAGLRRLEVAVEADVLRDVDHPHDLPGP